MRRRIVITILILVVASLSLSAKPEVWFGANFLADRNLIADSVKPNFKNLNGGSFEHLKALGPGFEVSFFPYDKVKLGLYASSHTLFPIGYLNDAGSVSGYRVRTFEYREDLTAGIAYHYLVSNWGFFANCSYDYSWYKVAQSNDKNSKAEVEYKRFQEQGITADAGLLAVSGNGYFKFGFSYSYIVSNGGQRIVLFCGGGTRL